MKDYQHFRVWWGNAPYQCDVIEAKTAQDALTIATLNFARNNLKPVRIKIEKPKPTERE